MTACPTIKLGELDIIEIDNPHCTAKVSLFGGHLLSFVPKSDGRERLWLSADCALDKSRALRGGIPVCWPWFAGQAPVEITGNEAPAHGFVRTQDWLVEAYTPYNEAHACSTLRLRPNKLGIHGFDEKLALSIEFSFGKECKVNLITRNQSDVSYPLSCALHSYFAITDIRHAQLKNVSGHYIDKLENDSIKSSPSPYAFTAETDRIHLVESQQPLSDCGILCAPPFSPEDQGSRSDRATVLQHSGHDSVVVWNPWIEKSSAMADMQQHGYETMLCVETALTQGFELKPNSTHQLGLCIG